MRRVLLAFLFAVEAFTGTSSWAVTLQSEGDTLFVSGPIGDDYVQFKKALDAPNLKQVVLVNSPGGDLWTGVHIARLIVEKNLNTVVAGYCASACSLLFVAGTERTFSDAFSAGETLIGIHGVHNKDSGMVTTGPTPEVYAFLKMRMGEHFNASIINKALYDIKDANGLLRIFDAQRELKNNTYFCRAGTTPRTDCEDFKGENALTLGIATRTELTKVNLPPSLKSPAGTASREQPSVIANQSAYFDDVSNARCHNDHCRQAIRDLVAGHGHKALAYALSGDGWGTSFNRSTSRNAFIGALYNCNHTKNRPAQLCEVQYLDIYDWHDEYGKSEARALELKAKLAIPFGRYFGGEESGPKTIDVPDILHLADTDTPTPLTIAGIQTYTTQELVQAMKSSEPPVIVDVSGGAMTLPGAQPLINGGKITMDTGLEAAYEDRFSGLLWAIAQNPAKPVVFFGKDRGSWHAVFAAVRAKKLGHVQSGWYRGGIESWLAAGLPLTAPAVRAVVEP